MALTLKGILASVAPVLASALPGPLGAYARSVIAKVLGKPDAPDAELEKTLAAVNPDILLKLKQAENEFIAEMKRLDIDLEKIAADDRASARGMQVQTKSPVPAILAGVLIGGFLSLVALLAFREVPAPNRDIIVAAVGIFGGQLVTVYQFYFGSSSGSAKKDETIAKLSE